MRPELKRLILKRMHDDHNDYDDMRDYAYSDNERGERLEHEYGYDHRRGGRMRNRDRHAEPYDDDDDYEKLHLPRKLKNAWKHKLINTDGTKGPHFSAEELMPAIDKMRLSFDGYSESDVCLVANMIYSDYGKTLKHVIPEDKETWYYVALAKDFLEDDDAGVEGAEKVLAYYHFIVNG